MDLLQSLKVHCRLILCKGNLIASKRNCVIDNVTQSVFNATGRELDTGTSISTRNKVQNSALLACRHECGFTFFPRRSSGVPPTQTSPLVGLHGAQTRFRLT
jgi:hypothetical protein